MLLSQFTCYFYDIFVEIIYQCTEVYGNKLFFFRYRFIILVFSEEQTQSVQFQKALDGWI